METGSDAPLVPLSKSTYPCQGFWFEGEVVASAAQNFWGSKGLTDDDPGVTMFWCFGFYVHVVCYSTSITQFSKQCLSHIDVKISYLGGGS